MTQKALDACCDDVLTYNYNRVILIAYRLCESNYTILLLAVPIT